VTRLVKAKRVYCVKAWFEDWLIVLHLATRNRYLDVLTRLIGLLDEFLMAGGLNAIIHSCLRGTPLHVAAGLFRAQFFLPKLVPPTNLMPMA
jgi:hypothetical protein